MNRFVPTALTTVALLVPASVLAPSATAAAAEAGTAVTGRGAKPAVDHVVRRAAVP